MKRHVVTGLVAVAVAVGLSGCSQEPEVPLAGIQPSDDHGHFAIETIALHASGATTSADLYDDAAGLLPNTLYDDGPGPAFPLTALVVQGQIVDVAPGSRFAAGEDAEGGRQVDFANENVTWRTLHATVRVDDVVGAADGVVPPEQVVVGFTLDGALDPEEFASSLLALPDSVFFLYKSQVYAYDDNVYAVRDEGSMFLTVESSELQAPALDDQAAEELLATTETYDELVDAAEEPNQTITYEGLG